MSSLVSSSDVETSFILLDLVFVFTGLSESSSSSSLTKTTFCFLAGDFFSEDFLIEDFLGHDFLAEDFLAEDFLAEDFFSSLSWAATILLIH